MANIYRPDVAFAEVSVLEYIANTKPLRWCSARSTTEIGVRVAVGGVHQERKNTHCDLKYIKVPYTIQMKYEHIYTKKGENSIYCRWIGGREKEWSKTGVTMRLGVENNVEKCLRIGHNVVSEVGNTYTI